MTGLVLGFPNSGGTWGKWDMCLCFGCGGVGGVGGWLGPGSGRLGWCYVCVCCEWILCVDGRSRYLCARRIPAHLRCT